MSDKVGELIELIKNLYSDEGEIPLHRPLFAGNEKKYVLDAVESTMVSSIGTYVGELEKKLTEYTGARESIAVVNGTAALHLSLQLAGVRPGDEVLTQSLPFVATANAITYNGGIPVFLDVDYDTMGLSPDAVGKFLDQYCENRNGVCINTQTERAVSACLPVHTFGFPGRIPEILDVCRDWNIPVIEDAAAALGSKRMDTHVGTSGLLGIFSFNGNKIVTAGGGGTIVTNDTNIANLARHLVTTAKVYESGEYSHDMLGYNFKMPNLNAALATAQLEQLDHFLKFKRELALKYEALLAGSNVKFRLQPEETSSNYWLMCVELDGRESRDQFIDRFQSYGIKTQPIRELMYHLPMYRQCYRDDQKNTLKLKESLVTIPSSVK